MGIRWGGRLGVGNKQIPVAFKNLFVRQKQKNNVGS